VALVAPGGRQDARGLVRFGVGQISLTLSRGSVSSMVSRTAASSIRPRGARKFDTTFPATEPGRIGTGQRTGSADFQLHSTSHPALVH
jgi:hypothetical protein